MQFLYGRLGEGSIRDLCIPLCTESYLAGFQACLWEAPELKKGFHRGGIHWHERLSCCLSGEAVIVIAVKGILRAPFFLCQERWPLSIDRESNLSCYWSPREATVVHGWNKRWSMAIEKERNEFQNRSNIIVAVNENGKRRLSRLKGEVWYQNRITLL